MLGCLNNPYSFAALDNNKTISLCPSSIGATFYSLCSGELEIEYEDSKLTMRELIEKESFKKGLKLYLERAEKISYLCRTIFNFLSFNLKCAPLILCVNNSLNVCLNGIKLYIRLKFKNENTKNSYSYILISEIFYSAINSAIALINYRAALILTCARRVFKCLSKIHLEAQRGANPNESLEKKKKVYKWFLKGMTATVHLTNLLTQSKKDYIISIVAQIALSFYYTYNCYAYETDKNKKVKLISYFANTLISINFLSLHYIYFIKPIL